MAGRPGRRCRGLGGRQRRHHGQGVQVGALYSSTQPGTKEEDHLECLQEEEGWRERGNHPERGRWRRPACQEGADVSTSPPARPDEEPSPSHCCRRRPNPLRRPRCPHRRPHRPSTSHQPSSSPLSNPPDQRRRRAGERTGILGFTAFARNEGCEAEDPQALTEDRGQAPPDKASAKAAGECPSSGRFGWGQAATARRRRDGP